MIQIMIYQVYFYMQVFPNRKERDSYEKNINLYKPYDVVYDSWM